MADDQDITPAILLQHMQAMERRIMQYMGERFSQVDSRFSRMEARFDEIEVRLSKLARQVSLLSVQIGDMDQRLDEIEIELFPKRVVKLEEVVGIGK